MVDKVLLGTVEEMSSSGSIVIKLGKCLWLALVWMPIFWPLWFSHWVLSSACYKPSSSGRKALDDEIQDNKKPGLSTKGSLGLFIIIAAAVLKVIPFLPQRVEKMYVCPNYDFA